MQPDVSYIPYAISYKVKNGNIITCTQFEEGNLLSDHRNDTESGNKYVDGSNLAPLISEE